MMNGIQASFTLIEQDEDKVRFGHPESPCVCEVVMPIGNWEDIGSPKEIFVQAIVLPPEPNAAEQFGI